jgi:hypothetical protein
VWECGRCSTRSASSCRQDGFSQDSGRIIIIPGSMHLFGCCGCWAMVPQLDTSGAGSSALDAYESLQPDMSSYYTIS